MGDKIQHQLIDRGGHKLCLKVHTNEPFSVPVVTEDALMSRASALWTLICSRKGTSGKFCPLLDKRGLQSKMATTNEEGLCGMECTLHWGRRWERYQDVPLGIRLFLIACNCWWEVHVSFSERGESVAQFEFKPPPTPFHSLWQLSVYGSNSHTLMGTRGTGGRILCPSHPCRNRVTSYWADNTSQVSHAAFYQVLPWELAPLATSPPVYPVILPLTSQTIRSYVCPIAQLVWTWIPTHHNEIPHISSVPSEVCDSGQGVPRYFGLVEWVNRTKNGLNCQYNIDPRGN